MVQSLKLLPDTPAAIDHLPDPGRILNGHPQQLIANLFDSADGKFSAGFWRCEPGSWRVVYTENELCHLLEGQVTILGDDGSVACYIAGDSFIVPAGFSGIWQTDIAARKLYAIYQP